MLLYVLYKSSIDIEPLSSTLHGVNACFIHHPSNVENYSIGHKSETGQPKKKKKKGASNSHIYTPFCTFWDHNSKYPSLQKLSLLFNITEIST